MPGSEQDFLNLIDRFFPKDHPSLVLPRGDDCAVIRCPGTLCLSTDLFLEDVHFRRSYFSPQDIGYKALAVNISDIAAMGARPLGFSLGLMAPRDLSDFFWEEFFTGMAEPATALNLCLTGGDLSATDCLGMSITIWGEFPVDRPLLTRGGGAPGDIVFALGPLGLARAGLLLLEEEGRSAMARFPQATNAHLRPSILIQEALHLAAIPEMISLMDVSDGLAADLPRFLPSGCGLDLEMTEESIHPEVRLFCAERALDPLSFALQGGEDYALLGCLPKSALPKIAHLPNLTVLGQVTNRPGLFAKGQPLIIQGFDHFVP